MYYVYVLKNKTKLYIGYSNNFERRLKEHLKEFPQDKLIYYEAYYFEQDARKREKLLKHYGSAWRALKKRISA
jgi:predicted GIY-YIG superfamily endonuclease